MSYPLRAAGNGQKADGTFAPGNKLGRGNPNNRRAQQLRNALIAAVSDDDIQEAVDAIKSVMRDGKPNERLAAAEALLDRLLGRPVPADQSERLEALEEAIAKLDSPPAAPDDDD